MRTQKKPPLVLVVAGTALIVLVHGYVLPHGLSAQSQTDQSGLRVKRIAVMPFLKGRCGESIVETLDCPVARLSFDLQKLSAGCDQILTGYVQEAIAKRHGEKVVPLGESKDVFGRMIRNEATDTLRSTAQDFGRTVDTNIVMVGTVWRYRERVGGPVAVESPASVAFAVALIDVTSGKVVWNGRFVETQASLSDNILDLKGFLRKGAKWLSANELARYGVNEIFQKYPV